VIGGGGPFGKGVRTGTEIAAEAKESLTAIDNEIKRAMSA
jgi:hypothetical protein